METNYLKNTALILASRRPERNFVKATLLSQVPPLEPDDVQKAKLPYHLAVQLDLQVGGPCVQFLQSILQFEHENYPKRPLSTSRKALDDLVYILQRFEQEEKLKNFTKSFNHLYEGCLSFGATYTDLNWITEELFRFTLSHFAQWGFSNKIYEGRTRFSFGKFLYERVKRFRSALDQFETFERLCEGHENDWIMSSTNYDLLHKNVQLYHVKCLRDAASYYSTSNPVVALGYIEKATEMLKSTSLGHLDLADCYLVYGKLLQKHERIDEAVAAFKSQIKHANVSGSMERICEGICAMIEIRLGLKQFDTVGRYMSNLETISQENNFLQYSARYNKFRGDILLATGSRWDALKEFNRVIDWAEEQSQAVENLDETRVTAGVVMSQELLKSYVDLMYVGGVGETNQTGIKKMMSWKNNRRIFWDTSNEPCDSWTRVIGQVQDIENSLNEIERAQLWRRKTMLRMSRLLR